MVRRRTQRRKSGITSLLFGKKMELRPTPCFELLAPGRWLHFSLSLGEDDLEALKAKNIKQTELVADLREAILRVARHFQCTDPKNCSVVSLGSQPTPRPALGVLMPHPKQARCRIGPFCSPGQELTPDYSMESHQRDHENYVACSRSHRRRAKALLDFERHDDDELGFRKNDIITVGPRGWAVTTLSPQPQRRQGTGDPGFAVCADRLAEGRALLGGRA